MGEYQDNLNFPKCQSFDAVISETDIIIFNIGIKRNKRVIMRRKSTPACINLRPIETMCLFSWIVTIEGNGAHNASCDHVIDIRVNKEHLA